MLADVVLEYFKVNSDSSVTSDTNVFAKSVDGFRSETTAAIANNGGHTRIVPTTHVLIIDQLDQTTLAEHAVSQVLAPVFPDNRLVDAELLEQPEVGLTTNFELQCAQRVRNVFERVIDAVSVIVRRIDAPFLTNVRMRNVFDTISDQVTHNSVLVVHVHLQAKSGSTFLKLALLHVFEQLQGLFNRPISPRAGNLLCSASLNFIRGLMAHESLVFLDQLHRKIVQLVQIVGGVSDFPGLVTHPTNSLINSVKNIIVSNKCTHINNGVDVFDALLLGVSVVKSQVTFATHLLSVTKAEVHSLSVTNVQVALILLLVRFAISPLYNYIRLGRETGDNNATSARQVFLEQLLSILLVVMWIRESNGLSNLGRLFVLQTSGQLHSRDYYNLTTLVCEWTYISFGSLGLLGLDSLINFSVTRTQNSQNLFIKMLSQQTSTKQDQ